MPNPSKAPKPRSKKYSVRWTRQLWSGLPTTRERNAAIDTRAKEIMNQKPLGPFIGFAEAKKIAFRQIGKEMGGYPAKAPFSSP